MRLKASLVFGRILFGCAMVPAGGRAEAPLLWNQPADWANCPVSSSAVWAEYDSGHECIRYFAGGAVDHAPTVIILFRGDRHKAARREPEEIPDNTAEVQEDIAERIAQQLGFPVIVVARPGTYGSSGNHFRTRRRPEFLALNAALDEIKERYRIGRFVLYGHSGGATTGAALLTMGRIDISCAVLTSGAFSLVERGRLFDEQMGRPPIDRLNSETYSDLYDPLDHVEGIVHDPQRRILIIGNENDRITPFAFQKAFADRLKTAGHKVQLINYPAVEPDFHNLKNAFGLKMAARCARVGMAGGRSTPGRRTPQPAGSKSSWPHF